VALQEAVAVSAADGFAQASGRVGVVNVHVAPGVGNSMSILHNASRARSPLVVTAGQQDSRLLLDEPILSGDLVQMTEQYTKWSYERDVLQTCLAHEGPSLVDVAIDRGFKAMT
jgi:benzoylformate decarboxylase